MAYRTGARRQSRGGGHGDQKRRAAHRLMGFHEGHHRPIRHDESKLLLEAVHALECIFDRINTLLEDDLLRWMLDLLIGQPAPMRQRPMAASP